MEQRTFPGNVVLDALDAMGREHDEHIREDSDGGGFAILADHPSFMLMFGVEMARVIGERYYYETDRATVMSLLIDMADVARVNTHAGTDAIYFPGWTLGED